MTKNCLKWNFKFLCAIWKDCFFAGAFFILKLLYFTVWDLGFQTVKPVDFIVSNNLMTELQEFSDTDVVVTLCNH